MKKYTSHPGFIALSFILLLGCGFLVSKYLIWPAYKTHRQNKLLVQAHAFFDKEDYNNAFLSIRKVIIESDSLEAWKLALKISENNPDQYQSIPQILNKLIYLDPQDASHFEKLILIALNTGNTDFAKDLLDRFPVKSDNENEFRQLKLQWALKTGDTKEAIDLLSDLSKDNSNNLGISYTLFNLQLHSENESTQSQGVEGMKDLALIDKTGREANLALLKYFTSNNDQTAAHIYLENIKNQEQQITLPEHFAIIEAELKFHDTDKANEDLLNLLKHYEEPSIEESVAIIDFLVSSQKLELATEWLTQLSEELIQTPPVGIKVAQALLIQKNWPQLSSHLLNQASWGDREYGKQLLLCAASLAQNDERLFKKSWDQTMLEATKQPDAFPVILKQVSQWGWSKQTLEILEKIFERNPNDDNTFNQLTLIYLKVGLTDKLINLLAQKLEVDPGNRSISNNFALLSLITNTHLTEGHAYARKNFESEPNNAYYITTWAYSLSLQGRTEDALSTLNKLSEEDAGDTHRKVYLASIYAILNDKESAEKLLKNIDVSALYPEEVRLAKQAIDKITTAEEEPVQH